MKIKLLIIGLFVFFLFGNLVSAECCERTVDGAWCQNAEVSDCDSNYRSLQTSCELSEFCTLGTCIDQKEGRCLPNTPKKVCEDAGGYWENKLPEELPQCSYGCCMYADQSAYVTQSRCGTLASKFGLNTTYRPDITNEIQCLAAAGGSAKGACVIATSEGTRNCRMLTKAECNQLKGNSGSSSITFNEGYLCSAEFLGTECKPRGGTTCVEGNSEVYFKDTCGNIANIYDASRLNDPLYWEKIVEKEESCGYDNVNGNANSASCGNCEYLLGSICEEYVRGENAKPTYGDYVCGDLSCQFEGKTYKHGEKWCATSATVVAGKTSTYTDYASPILGFYRPIGTNKKTWDGGTYLPGEESYVMKCYNGEVLMESCSTGTWRNQICVEEEFEGISYAQCTSNLWRDCVGQLTEEACSDEEVRDCKWVEGYSVYRDENNEPMTRDENGEAIEASCVPKYAPALDFWNPEGDSASICGLASRTVVVEYEFGVTTDRKAMDENNLKDQKERLAKADSVKNGEALEAHPGHDEWMDTMNEICASMGDCTATVNYMGYEGYHNPIKLLIQKFVRKAKNTEKELEKLIGEQ